MNTNSLNIKRLSNFIQRQLALNGPTLLIAAGAVFGVMLIVSFLVGRYNADDLEEGLKGFYMFVFFLGGYILTSNIFSELHSPQRSYFYLTLPVSTVEKLIGSWLLSSLVYVVIFSIGAGISYVFAHLIAGYPVSLGNFFDSQYLKIIGVYIVTQTIFFLGASYFRKHNFLKTLLAIFLVQLTIGVYAGLLGWMLFRGESMNNNDFSGDFKYFVEDVVPHIGKVFFWYMFAPFMLVVSYFSLKEREV